MSNYTNAANFERAIVAFLRKRGWIASRTPGSKGSFDVMALRGGVSYLLQLKKSNDSRFRMSEDDCQRLLTGAKAAGASCLVITWKHGGFDAFTVPDLSEIKNSHFLFD